MSCYTIYYNEGAKMMRPVTNRDEYLQLRDSAKQKNIVDAVRNGDEKSKHRLLQMNYSCMPNEDGSLKGSIRVTTTVGMDVDLHRDDFATEEDYQKALAEIPEKVLAKKDELGLLMLERSATKGYHLVFKRKAELSQEDNLRWASDLLGVEFDKGAKDITRVFFTTTASEDDLLFLDDELFINKAMANNPERVTEHSIGCKPYVQGTSTPQKSAESATEFHNGTMSPIQGSEDDGDNKNDSAHALSSTMPSLQDLNYLGIPYDKIIQKWWELYNDGQTPVKSNRDVLTFELAVNLRHIAGFDRETLDKVIPCYDGFPHDQKMKCIDSALSEKRTQMPKRLRDVLTELKKDLLRNSNDNDDDNDNILSALEEAEQEDELFYYKRIPQSALPQGIAESIKATGAKMAMPVLAVTCPAIGALATDVKVLIHGKETKLNMHSFVVGDAASCKGDLDSVVDAWMVEETMKNTIYYQQEEEFRAKKKAAKNAKSQPDEPHLPVRFLTMNNTVANLAERLANTDGKHAFSFTPEADTVAQKWRSSMSDFSTMLRQSYDGSRYDREAKSADATTVHIDHLLWNVCMCGTPDALYRVINNYTDGLLSRFIIAHTPDNTFAPLEDKPNLMTDKLRDRIQQIAHLLPLMQGTLNLPKLEERSRQWVEKVRREALKDDDRVMARARLRDHGTAMRMATCLILCAVAEKLIKQHGLSGAEKQLKMRPQLTAEMAAKMQTPAMLDAYEVMAESLIDNDMLYFREKLENANQNTGLSSDRKRGGKNDRIYDRLSDTFTFEQAMGAKGSGCTHNSVRQMLKNWRKQGLIKQVDEGRYQKITNG